MKENEELDERYSNASEVNEEYLKRQAIENLNKSRTYSNVDINNVSQRYTKLNTDFDLNDPDNPENGLSDVDLLLEQNPTVQIEINKHPEPYYSAVVASCSNCTTGVVELFSDDNVISDSLKKISDDGGNLIVDFSAYQLKVNAPGLTVNNVRNQVELKDTEVKAKAADFLLELDKKYTEIENRLKKSNKENTVAYRVIKLIHNHTKLVRDNNFALASSINPLYSSWFEASFVNFPGNKWIVEENGQKKTIVDDKRLEEMLKSIPFLDQIEAKQKFFMEKTMPYAAKRATRPLERNEVVEYRKEYMLHLQEQDKYANDILRVKGSGENINTYIKENDTFAKNPSQSFVDNWQGERFCKSTKTNCEKHLKYLDHGWPVEDFEFLNSYDEFQSTLTLSISASVNDATKLKQLTALVDEITEAKKYIDSVYIVSPEQRLAVIDKLNAPLKKYMAIEYPNGAVNKEPMFSRIITKAANAKFEAQEIGQGPLRIIPSHGDYDREFGGFDKDTVKANVDIMVKDLNSVELFYKGSNEFKRMKESLLELKEYVDNQYDSATYANSNDERVKYDLMTKLVKVQDATTKYLDYKGVQFEQDKTRRDSAKKQKREQPRIKMALGLRDKLVFMMNNVEEIAIQDSIKEPAISKGEEKVERLIDDAITRCKDKIKKEGKLVKDLYANIRDFKLPEDKEQQKKALDDYKKSVKEYKEHFLKMAIYYRDSLYSYLEPHPNESFDEFQARITKVGAVEYTRDDIGKVSREYVGMATVYNNLKKEINDMEEAKKNGMIADSSILSIDVENNFKKLEDICNDLRVETNRKRKVMVNSYNEHVNGKKPMRYKATKEYKDKLISKPVANSAPKKDEPKKGSNKGMAK
ncbi:MAG: hypothetical protein K5656_01055 [Lachnospiraceae bacterium]|nr:hypothetical protein [Lachnospiraceae bacterium]